jgi:hypothetical protein
MNVVDIGVPFCISPDMPDKEIITTEAMRVRLRELALELQAECASVGIRSGRGSPRYQLAAPQLLDPERLRTCVPVTPDEFRRKSGEIRALVRLEDVPFGITIDKLVKAIFQRHPSYRPSAADEFREIHRIKRGARQLDDVALRALESRVTEIEKRYAWTAADCKELRQAVRRLERKVPG